jgi:hypothetical protein
MTEEIVRIFQTVTHPLDLQIRDFSLGTTAYPSKRRNTKKRFSNKLTIGRNLRKKHRKRK